MAEKILLNNNIQNSKQTQNSQKEESDIENNQKENNSDESKSVESENKYNLFEENKQQFIQLRKYLKYEQEFIEKEVKPFDDSNNLQINHESEKFKSLRSEISKKTLNLEQNKIDDSVSQNSLQLNSLFANKKLDKVRSFLKDDLGIEVENNPEFHKYTKDQEKKQNLFKKKNRFGINLGKIFKLRERKIYILKLKFIFDSPKYIMYRYFLNRSSKYFMFVNNIYKILIVCSFLVFSKIINIDLGWLIVQSLYLLWVLLCCPFERWYHNVFLFISESTLLFLIVLKFLGNNYQNTDWFFIVYHSFVYFIVIVYLLKVGLEIMLFVIFILKKLDIKKKKKDEDD
jgi:hypothetical protein